jgi:integrator complex subunit 11
MFDCGMQAGRRDDARRFPLLRRLTTPSSPSAQGGVAPHPDGGVTAAVDAVLVSHFHLDHVGALPYLVGVLGYRGPVVMTAPTAAVTPIMLDDYRRVRLF